MTLGGLGGLLSLAQPVLANFYTKVLKPFFGASQGRRRQSLSRPTYVSGFAFFKGKNILAIFHKPRSATKEGEDDYVLLGTISNDPLRPAPRLLPLSVLDNVICIADKDTVPEDVPKGPTIDKSEVLLASCFVDSSGNPYDNNDKVAVRLACSLPLGYGTSVKTGTLDQGSFDGLDRATDSSDASWWAVTLNKHDGSVQKLLLEEEELKKYLPPAPPTGHQYVATPYFKPEHPDDDDAELGEDVHALQLELTDVAQHNISQRHTSAPTDGASEAPTDVVLVDKSATKSNAAPPAAPKPPAPTESDLVHARALALGATYDRSTGKVTMPTLSDFMPQVLNSSTKQAQRESTENALSSIDDQLGDSPHFLLRSIDLPDIEKIGLAHIASCKWSKDNIATLKIDTAPGVVLVILMPDTKSTAKLKSDAKGAAEAEDALGEHASKRTKLATTFTSVSELTTVNSLVSTLGNTVLVGRFYWNFTLEQTTPLPSMIYFISELAKKVTSREGRKWMRENAEQRQQLLYFVFNATMACVAALARASHDVAVTGAILKKDFANIPTINYHLADTIFVDALGQLDRIFLGSMGPPATRLWETSAAKERQDKKEQNRLLAVLSPRGDRGGGDGDKEKTRRGSHLKDGGPPTKKLKSEGPKEGWIICQSANFQLPKECHNPGYKLCKSNTRDGVSCPWGPACDYAHDQLHQLTKPRQKAIVTMVDANSNLEFVNVDEKLLKSIRES